MLAEPVGRLFRFDAERHEYIDLRTGALIPNISLLLERAGLVDRMHFDEESAERGKHVHKMTADYDIGAMPRPHECQSAYKSWLLGHVALRAVLGASMEILAIEEPSAHPRFNFAGRKDRVVRYKGQRGVWEIKSGAVAKSHKIQTALQAILDSGESGIPAHLTGRWIAYYRPDGTYIFRAHDDPRDVVEADSIIRTFAR